MKESIYYAYGAFIPQSEAKLSLNDLGFVRAYSAYECLRTYNRQLFHLEDHLTRLVESCRQLRIMHPAVDLKALLETLVEKNSEHTDLVIRIYITAGLETTEEPELFVLADPMPYFPKEYYTKGIATITTPAGRLMTSVKSTQYSNAMILLKAASEQKAQDVIYVDEMGHLLELTRANFFAVQGNTLFTPTIDVLPGITRKIVFEIAKTIGLETTETPIALGSIESFNEAFLTSTVKEIMPIWKIDDHELRGGPVVEKLQNAFREYVQSYANSPLTPLLV